MPNPKKKAKNIMGKDNSRPDLEKDQAEKNYDRVIILIQYYVQLFWLIFGAFLLAVTVLLGGIISIMKDGPTEWIFAGAIFGLILCLPWWTTFRYNHSFYQLRVNEAKCFEPTSGSKFFLNGQDLFDGKEVFGVKIPKYAIKLRPKYSISLLIILFAVAFLGIAIINNPWYSFNNSNNQSKPTEQCKAMGDTDSTSQK